MVCGGEGVVCVEGERVVCRRGGCGERVCGMCGGGRVWCVKRECMCAEEECTVCIV